MEGNVIPPACPATPTSGTRFAAPAVTETGPSEALQSVTAEAGAWPRDEDDDGYVVNVVGTPVESRSWSRIKAMYR